jgi:hypothetical protein
MYLICFPSFLCARRRNLGLSPASVAAFCDLTPELMERIERGHFLPSPSQAYRMALALTDPVHLGTLGASRSLVAPGVPERTRCPGRRLRKLKNCPLLDILICSLTILGTEL